MFIQRAVNGGGIERYVWVGSAESFNTFWCRQQANKLDLDGAPLL